MGWLRVQLGGTAHTVHSQEWLCYENAFLPVRFGSRRGFDRAQPRVGMLQKRGGERAEGSAERRAERREKSTAAARSIGASVQQFRRDAETTREQIGVDAEEAGESLQRSHLSLKGSIGEVELIALGLASFGNSLLARQVVGEFAEAGRIARAGGAICRGLLERIERTGERALRLSGDGSFIGGAEAGIIQNILKLWHEQIADLLLLAKELLVQRINVGKLLVGQLPCLVLCTASHGKTSEVVSRKF